jgi:hypothetical protein
MTNREYEVACAILDDTRKLIAALKLQRWDLLKWTVSVNVGLATASALFQKAPGQVLVFACIVDMLSLCMMLHYFCRLTNTRNDGVRTDRYLIRNGVRLPTVTGIRPKRYTLDYEWQELSLFTIVIFASVVPAFLVFWQVSA